MLAGVSRLLGGAQGRRRGDLIGGGELRAPLTFARAQAAGVEAAGQIDLRLTLVAPNAISAPLVFTRAQAAGVQATGDV